jgi:putative Holliday junction resolvase
MTADVLNGGPADRRTDPTSEVELRVLGIDWGTKRIGLALSDPSGTLAQPLATLTRRAGRRFPLQQLKAHLDRWRPVAVVVGLPLEADGSDGPAAREAREMARLIGEKAGLPVELMDERMTTARALQAGRSRPGDQVDVDQRAATVLLQLYLDRRRGR